MRAICLVLVFGVPALGQGVADASRQNIENARGAVALANAAAGWQRDWEKERFGKAPKLTATQKKKIDDGRDVLPEYQRQILERMAKGERPNELDYHQLLEIRVGDYGTISRPFILDTIFDDDLALCYFIADGHRNFDKPFVLKGRDTKALIAGRAYEFGSDLVFVRKSEDFPKLPVQKGMIAVEVLDKRFSDLAQVIYPPPKSTRAKRSQ